MGPLVNHALTASVELPSGRVMPRDIARAIGAAEQSLAREGRRVVHAAPVAYRLGYEQPIADPVGMLGDILKVDLQVVSAEAGPIRNLRHCLERSHLALAGMIPAAYASARAVVTEEEAQAGVLVLDMGAGMTGMALLAGGQLVFADSLAVGGQHLTADIAAAFSLSSREAERVKTLHASVFPTSELAERASSRRMPANTDFAAIAKADLSQITRIRLEQIFGEVCERLRSVDGLAPSFRRVVLTGGASEVIGAADLAGSILGKPARLGRPPAIPGMPEGGAGGALAASVGLLVHLLEDDQRPDRAVASEVLGQAQGYLARVGQWLRESF
jgi:cell division protein FtsA